MRWALGWESVTVTILEGTAGLEALSGSPGRAGSCQAVPGQCPGLCPGCARSVPGAVLRSAPGASTPKSCTQAPRTRVSLCAACQILLALCFPPASLTLNATDFSCFTSALYSAHRNSELPFGCQGKLRRAAAPGADSLSPSIPACPPSPRAAKRCQPSALKTKLKRHRKPKQP